MTKNEILQHKDHKNHHCTLRNGMPTEYEYLKPPKCLKKKGIQYSNGTYEQWVLKDSNLLNNEQSGFRKNRSCIDNLVQLEETICNGFILKEQVTAIFFDLERAFDTCWKHKIIDTLSKWNIRGNILHFIANFLNNRKACV